MYLDNKREMRELMVVLIETTLAHTMNKHKDGVSIPESVISYLYGDLTKSGEKEFEKVCTTLRWSFCTTRVGWNSSRIFTVYNKYDTEEIVDEKEESAPQCPTGLGLCTVYEGQ